MWDFVVKVNLYGVFNCSSIGASYMHKCGCADGVIINIASIAGIEGQKGQLAYAASKGGVIGMTLPMARDLARYNVRVMCIAPGIMNTPLMAKAPAKVAEGLLKGVGAEGFTGVTACSSADGGRALSGLQLRIPDPDAQDEWIHPDDFDALVWD